MAFVSGPSTLQFASILSSTAMMSKGRKPFRHRCKGHRGGKTHRGGQGRCASLPSNNLFSHQQKVVNKYIHKTKTKQCGMQKSKSIVLLSRVRTLSAEAQLMLKIGDFRAAHEQRQCEEVEVQLMNANAKIAQLELDLLDLHEVNQALLAERVSTRAEANQNVHTQPLNCEMYAITDPYL